ncbi:MAG: flagellar brake protein [Rhodocyclaceae bacterium]|nr:flagellar brake protein [Rhodocyclaceae bacterium]
MSEETLPPPASPTDKPAEASPPPAKPAHNALIPHDDAYTRYLLESPNEIMYVLRDLAAESDKITVYFNEGKDFLLTTIIALDDEGIVFDFGSSQDMNRRAVEAKKFHCVASQNKVRVQFQVGRFTKIDYEGSPAFRSPLPVALLRLQRREFYRLISPIARPLKCTIPLKKELAMSKESIEVSVIDIGGGGLGLAAAPVDFPFETGTTFENCRIDLPEIGIVTATLRVKSLFDITLRSGALVKRAGCEFIKLPGPMLTLIQRHIIKIERERKARENGTA